MHNHPVIFSGHGGWSEYVFDPCSVTCGGGTQIGSRACDNPSPVGTTGSTCPGSTTVSQECGTEECSGKERLSS